MQGYYFSRPVSQAECTRMLREGRRMEVGITAGKLANGSR
jgi:hypothetical protein